MNASLILAILAALALWAGSLYAAPFGRCPRCRGTGHIKRGPRRRPVCPRCKGRRRVQRHGSRTVHQLARRVRQGRQAATRHQPEEDSDGTP
jgi:DnaJ-class molecular chaperone